MLNFNERFWVGRFVIKLVYIQDLKLNEWEVPQRRFLSFLNIITRIVHVNKPCKKRNSALV